MLGNYEDSDNFVANLTAEGRTVVSLEFYDDACSIEALVTQVPLAVQAVRCVVANNSAFDDGYIIVAHSQGGAVSRAVIEEMDDHGVRRYISMAGTQNGIFTGWVHVPHRAGPRRGLQLHDVRAGRLLRQDAARLRRLQHRDPGGAVRPAGRSLAVGRPPTSSSRC
jgi:hypothetical protein